MSLFFFIVFFTGLLAAGMPIAFSMITASVLYAFFNGIDLGFLGTQMYASMNNFILMAIPLFLLASEIMDKTLISKRMFKFANSLVGVIPGGLGHVNVLTSIIFSGMSGAAVADAGGIGRLCYRAMVEEGYDKPFSMSLTAASAVIGPIIPPSIPFVVYAMVMNESVGKLFFGGIIPGLILGLALMAYVFIIAIKRKYKASAQFSFSVLLRSFKEAFLSLMTPLILLGTIYFGVVTVTEAAAVAVIYACILGFIVYRNLTIRDFWDSLKKVFFLSGSIVLLFPAAKVFGFVLIKEDIPQLMMQFTKGFAGEPLLIILFVNIVFFVMGCISDPLVNIMLFMPIFQPLIQASGLSSIHFGIMIVLNAMIGLITPPVGALLITINSFDKVKFSDLMKETWPFILIEVFVLGIVVFFPQTVLYIPNLLFEK